MTFRAALSSAALFFCPPAAPRKTRRAGCFPPSPTRPATPHRPTRLCAALAACLALPALAQATPCGTAVIPNNIGQDDPGPVTSLNPLLAASIANVQASLLLYRPLIWPAGDPTAADGIDHATSLAEAIIALDGNTRMRVRLKPWRWSDGAAITSDDIRFFWDLVTSLGDLWAYAGQAGLPGRVRALATPGPDTVDFLLTTPTNPDFFARNALPVVFALPRHAWARHGTAPDRDTLWQRQADEAFFSVTDGPFQLARFAPGDSLALTANPLYGGPAAKLARLVLDFGAGGSALRALQTGRVDMAHIPVALWDRVRTTPGFHALRLPEPAGYTALTLNLRNPTAAFLQDARIRRALTDATPQAGIIKILYRGFASPNRIPIPAESTALRSPAARANTLPVREDSALARAELDAAGWAPGPDGIRARGKIRLSLTVLVSTPDGARMLEIMQPAWRAVGVELRIQTLPGAALFDTIAGPPEAWQAAIQGLSVTGLPTGTGTYNTGGGGNAGGYSSPQMDRLIARAETEPGVAALYAYQDYWAAEQPWNILPQQAYPLLVSNRLGGAAEMANPQGYWRPEALYLMEGCHADPAPAR